jgi:hypothetical protein
MTTTLHITEKAINSIHIPRLPTRKQEFGNRHRDSLRCCQTHAFLAYPGLQCDNDSVTSRFKS